MKINTVKAITQLLIQTVKMIMAPTYNKMVDIIFDTSGRSMSVTEMKWRWKCWHFKKYIMYITHMHMHTHNHTGPNENAYINTKLHWKCKWAAKLCIAISITISLAVIINDYDFK